MKEQVQELALKEQAITIESQAQELIIDSSDSFTKGGEFLKQTKELMKGITSFFEPMKTKAYASWKGICAREKEFTSPLAAADIIVKKKMGIYQTEQERIQQEKDRKKREEEAIAAAALAKKAEELRDIGLDESANELFDEPVRNVIDLKNREVQPTKPSGISFRKDYEVEVIDEESVPTYFRGYVIRPVDLAAIKKLAKAADGDISIKGIKITETKTTVVR